MSTRYLWDVYNVEQKPTEKQQRVTSSWQTIDTSLTYCAALAKDYEISGSGIFRLKDPLWVTNIFRRRIDEYKYMIISSSDVDTAGATGFEMFYNKYQSSYSEPLMWGADGSTGSAPYIQYNIIAVKESQYGQSGATQCGFAKCTIEKVPSKGGIRIGTASSANRNEYPDDGVSNDSWYVYRGSDSIDPLSVTYSTDRPERGQAVTVTVEPHPAEEAAPQWTASSLPSSASWSIASGGGWLVAIGRGTTGGIARSSDGGKTWASASQQSASSAFAAAYGGGRFVATGLNSAWYSTDNGATWTAASSLPNGQWSSVCYGGGKFVAADSAATKAMYSTDGNTWAEVSTPGEFGWNSVAYGDGKFVAVGIGWSTYSTDGVSWTAAKTPGASRTWRSIAYGNGRFVAINAEGGSILSVDGQSWVESSMPENLDWTGIAYGGGRFVAIALSTTVSAFSADGWTWETMTMPASSNWFGIARGDDGFAAVSLGSSSAAYLPDEVDLEYTVSYLYQYSTNSGASWITVGTATADAQIEITIPESAEQFMARVRAQDDIGFTSADYVAGANLAVQTMRLWVGVVSAAKQGRKLWIGVGGTARPVVRGWVGDENGKARRWF